MKISLIYKIIIFVLTFSLVIPVLAEYRVKNKWLDNRNSYQINIDDNMNTALAGTLSDPDIAFDPASCIQNMQPSEVNNEPVVQLGNLNNLSSTLLRYSDYYVDQYQDTIYFYNYEYGITRTPPVTCEYNTFIITLNSSNLKDFPWDKNGEPYEDPDTGEIIGGIDINTIFRHELGHVYGLEHSTPAGIPELMHSGAIYESYNFPALEIDDQVKSGMKVLFDPPNVEIVDNAVRILLGESISFTVEGPVDKRLLDLNDFFFGYIKYPYSVSPISAYSGYYINPENEESHYFSDPERSVVKATFTFTPEQTGVYYFKAYTTMDWNSQGILESNEMNFRPFKEVEFEVVGDQCEITEPKDYTVEAINFERYMGIKGKAYTDGSVDLSTGIPTYEVTDVVNDVIDRTIKYEYTWPVLRLTNLYDDVVGDDNFKMKSNDSTNINSMTVFQKEMKNDIMPYKYNPKTLMEDTVIWYDQGSFVEGVYNNIYSAEDTTFDTKPGLYKISGHIYDDKMNKELVEHDTMWYIKPSWNIKLDGDYWYKYDESTRIAGAPYVPKRVYSREQNISMYAWRPFEDLLQNDINIAITDENNYVVDNTSITSGQYNTYSKEFDMYPFGSVTIGGLISEPVEWERTGNEKPGFYKITATAIDPYHGHEVIRKEEIQLPPLYITAETDAYWPYTQWPGMYDNPYYEKIWDVGFDTTPGPAMGEKSIIIVNDPNRDPQDPLDQWTYQEAIHPGVTINKDYNVEFGVAIGIAKVDDVYQLWKGEYSIAISVDGGAWETIKTVDSNDWESEEALSGWTDGIVTMDFIIPLGNKVTKGSHVRFKLMVKAFPEYFSYYGPDYIFSRREIVWFDEIRIMYSKKENLPAPNDLSASHSANKHINNLVLNWTAPTVSNSKSMQVENYKIYRDGKCIGTTIDMTFTDYDIIGGTTYEYAVTACYNDIDYDKYDADPPESPILDCKITFTTELIDFPSPINFNLTEGTDGDDNCVYLEWDCSSDNVDYFEIYRNDILYTKTSLTKYEDLWLDDGNYTYKIKAIYTTPTIGESEFSVSLNATITSPVSLPIIEGFENGGNIPEGWVQNAYSEGFEFVTTNQEGSLPYEGDYFAYIYNFDVPHNANQTVLDELCTPIYDLSGYKDVTLSYKYLLQNDTIYSHFDGVLDIRIRNTEPIHTYGWVDISEIFLSQLDQYNAEWQTNSVLIPNELITDTVRISFAIRLVNTYEDELQQFSLDNIVISATPKLTPPSNILATRTSTSTILTWDTVTGADKYCVYRSTKPDIDYKEIGSTAATTFEDFETGLEDGVYFYKVVSESAQKVLSKIQNPTRLKGGK